MSAALAQGVSTVTGDAAPPFEGYCRPSVDVPVDLTISTADGRLNETLAVTLVALVNDDSTAFNHTNPYEGWLPLTSVAGAWVLPAEFDQPGHTIRRLDFDFQIDGPTASGLEPYCAASHERSGDAAQSCNVYSAVVRYHSRTIDAYNDHHNVSAADVFNAALQQRDEGHNEIHRPKRRRERRLVCCGQRQVVLQREAEGLFAVGDRLCGAGQADRPGYQRVRPHWPEGQGVLLVRQIDLPLGGRSGECRRHVERPHCGQGGNGEGRVAAFRWRRGRFCIHPASRTLGPEERR